MTPAESAKNARRIVLQQMGYPPDTLPVDLKPDVRIQFYDNVARYIKENPADFSPEQQAIANRRVSSDLYQKPLEDTSFDWGMFGNEVANNAVKITSAGGNVIRNAVYLAVVILIVVYFFPRIVGAFTK